MELADARIREDIHNRTGLRRMRLNHWDHITHYKPDDDVIQLIIETYDVQVLVREDRYNKKGLRMVMFKRLPTGKWVVELDHTSWDEDFEPFVFEKIGRRPTADELIEQREWEKLCYRPGNKKTPLDSYDRVQDPFFRSTDRMERHF